MRHRLAQFVTATAILGVGLAAAFFYTAHGGCSHGLKVVSRWVRDDGLVATYFRPKGETVRPALIVVGGSEGGIRSAESLAYILAENGWATLAVAYFGMDALPPHLANIPLEYFDRAVTWLQHQPHVDARDLGIVGGSRGAELALLLASHNPALRRVVAFAPSHVVWGPVLNEPSGPSVSAWSLAGQPLPFMPALPRTDPSGQPLHGTPAFLEGLKDTQAVAAARIPVEKISGPILLLSGEDDQLWPSTVMANAIVAQLRGVSFAWSVEHFSFAGAGHVIEPGASPGMTKFKNSMGITVALGGSRRANAAAQKQAWTATLEFLRTPLASAAPAVSAH